MEDLSALSLGFKEDARSRIEFNGSIVRKICYDEERGRREAEITAFAYNKCSDHVVKLERTEYDSEGHLVLVFPYISPSGTRFMYSGKSFLDKRKSLSDRDLKPIILALSRTVLELHRNRVAHRDLNISNIVFDEEKHVQLIDFELSRSDAYENLECMCTADGASPELLSDIRNNKTITHTDPFLNDIWGLGKIVTDFVCGDRTKSLALLSQAQIDIRIEEMTHITHRIFRRILHTCLQVDPSNRGKDLVNSIAEIEAFQFPESPHIPKVSKKSVLNFDSIA